MMVNDLIHHDSSYIYIYVLFTACFVLCILQWFSRYMTDHLTADVYNEDEPADPVSGESRGGGGVKTELHQH